MRRVAETLVDLARAAEEVVLGGRGIGGFYRLRLGSVAAQVAAHAVCPVTALRGECGPAGVVIGVDGSESGQAALDHGFRYASRHGLSVQALRTYPPPIQLPRMGYPPVSAEHIRDSALQLVTDAAAMEGEVPRRLRRVDGRRRTPGRRAR